MRAYSGGTDSTLPPLPLRKGGNSRQDSRVFHVGSFFRIGVAACYWCVVRFYIRFWIRKGKSRFRYVLYRMNKEEKEICGGIDKYNNGKAIRVDKGREILTYI